MPDTGARRRTAIDNIPFDPDPKIGPLSSGTLLEGMYRIIEPVGAGSMGFVYRAHDERLDRSVAIKLIRPEACVHPAFRARFEAEARVMARVRHPNVVEVFAFGEYGQVPYFVMEYVDGVDLGTWSQSRMPMPVDEVLGILEPLCRGVQALHEAGAVHRDLKPRNILVGPAFRIAVADLGLARLMDELVAEPGVVAGTPAYMAPELVRGDPVRPELATRADVYAVAVLAYELLTGRWPVEGEDSGELMQAHVNAVPTPVTELRPDLPRAFDRVFAQALEKDPKNRIASVDALRRMLADARREIDEPRRPLSVLLVDDDADQRGLVEYWLRKEFGNVRVHHASDGNEALDRTRHMPAPDLAIVDLHMPQMGGAQLTAAFKSAPRTHHMPIIIVTGFGGAPDWKVLKRLGAEGFVVKPVDAQQLLSLARRLTTGT